MRTVQEVIGEPDEPDLGAEAVIDEEDGEYHVHLDSDIGHHFLTPDEVRKLMSNLQDALDEIYDAENPDGARNSGGRS